MMMNDFTIEELETIEKWGEVYTEFGNSWVDRVERPLIEKIHSMIENYCEYKTSTMVDYCCNKCNEEWHNCECKDE